MYIQELARYKKKRFIPNFALYCITHERFFLKSEIREEALARYIFVCEVQLYNASKLLVYPPNFHKDLILHGRQIPPTTPLPLVSKYMITKKLITLLNIIPWTAIIYISRHSFRKIQHHNANDPPNSFRAWISKRLSTPSPWGPKIVTLTLSTTSYNSVFRRNYM